MNGKRTITACLGILALSLAMISIALASVPKVVLVEDFGRPT